MFCRIFLALALTLVASETAFAQEQKSPMGQQPNIFQGTPAEQAACRPDSVKFCRDAIPDTFRVLACLQQNRERISKACREVLESHGQ
ncbi:MAG TPA: hypothetical protein VKT73_03255 [Xanthobacteraceae bacterium]|nr:hypothetical protein [Xanthobacteraceae bacterium]